MKTWKINCASRARRRPHRQRDQSVIESEYDRSLMDISVCVCTQKVPVRDDMTSAMRFRNDSRGTSRSPPRSLNKQRTSALSSRTHRINVGTPTSGISTTSTIDWSAERPISRASLLVTSKQRCWRCERARESELLDDDLAHCCCCCSLSWRRLIYRSAWP